MEYSDFIKFFDALNKFNVKYILIGAIALTLKGLPRTTRDIYIVFFPSKENINNLISALKFLWNDPEIEKIKEEELLREYPVLRYGPPEGNFFIDVIIKIWKGKKW